MIANTFLGFDSNMWEYHVLQVNKKKKEKEQGDAECGNIMCFKLDQSLVRLMRL